MVYLTLEGEDFFAFGLLMEQGLLIPEVRETRDTIEGERIELHA